MPAIPALRKAGRRSVFTQTVPLSGSFSRPQMFFGRLPEAIADVLSACGVRPYLVPAGIALKPADEPESETVLDLDSVSGPWICAKNTSPVPDQGTGTCAI